ncbi:MAG TPA: AzlD domain-containing protein [Ktedonobacteraceae bacterium]|nr:AzlD domain-containing protein [Ktedonobacteraceae bacterium]
MQISLPALLAILGMACITYLTRISGLALMSRVTLSKRVEAWLGYIPGAVLVAIIAPTVLTSGPAEALAALATALAAIRTRNFLLAMLVGVGVVWILRTLAGLK